MSRQRFALLIAVALVTIAAAFYVSTLRDAPHEAPASRCCCAAQRPERRHGRDGAQGQRDAHPDSAQMPVNNGRWRKRADYPADVSKLRQLLVSLRDAKIVEAKTADPARFSAIGGRGSGRAGAAGPKSRC